MPITITEGAKKAASLLSQGHAAIGLPGIYAGYRSKDEQGNEIKARLMDELAVFGTLGREIKFCFDYETRPDTKRNIEIAISRTGSLLEHLGAKVSVITLPGPDKGVDDFLKTQSALAYEKLAISALHLRAWRDYNKQHQQVIPKPPLKLSLEERKERIKAFLADIPHNGPALNKLEKQAAEVPKSFVTLPPDSQLPIQYITEHENSRERPNTQHLQPINSPDIVKRPSSTLSPSQSKIKSVGAEPYQFTTGARELSQAISGAVEQQEQERIAGAVKKLSRSLGDCQPSVVGPKNLRTAIAQFHAAITAELRQQTNRRLLNAIADYIEHEVVQSTPALIEALEELSKNLNKLLTPDRARAVKQLDTAIYDATQQNLGLDAKQKDDLQIQNQPITAQPKIIWSKVAGKEDLSSKEMDVATQLGTLEQQRLSYKRLYQQMQEQVRSYPGFRDSSIQEVDVGVALLVMKESSDHNEVGRVLAQSDQLKAWKALLPEEEYMTTGEAYIHQIYEQAQQVRQMRSLQQQQKRDSDMEF